MTRDEVKSIVIELLQELTTGIVRNQPTKDADGDEWNNYVFDGEKFVDRIFSKQPVSENRDNEEPKQ